MYSLYFGLAVHLLLVASAFSSDVKNEKDDKMLIMLEFEPIKAEDRSKRSSAEEAVRKERQSPEVPQEYLGLLQQLSAQQQQQQQQQQQAQPQQQQASASAQQPQQQLIQQLVVSRDGSRPPTAARYVLTQDGRLIDESSLAVLGQQQQLIQGLPPQQYSQGQAQAQALGLPIYQQNPLQSTQPQQIPAAPAQPVRPGQRPQISEFARQQQRILQEVRDAPLRAQIAGFTIRPPQNPVQPLPTGPNSQSPQVFTPAGQQQPQQQFALQQPFQDPQNPNIVYTPIPVDPQTYQLQLQQQQQQQQLAAQYGVETESRQLFAQAPRPSSVPQQVVYQQPIPQEISQDRIRRPINVLPAPSASQPQVVQQNLPQQYLIETTKPTAQPPQFVPQGASPQIQYVQQPVQQPQPQPIRQPEQVPSTLLQPVAGRGLFTPVKPSRSSIFVSRSSAPKSLSIDIADDVTSEKVPVVRLPTPANQRPLSRQEFDALVSAGYNLTPVPVPQQAPQQAPQQVQYLKAKRQPLVEERRNHVVYENPQDGVQYQYSPGSSDGTATIRTKN